MGVGESGVIFNDLNRQFNISRYAWADPALGNNVGIGVASIPTYWFLSLLENIGIPGFLLQAILFWSLFVIAGLSIYFLTKELFSETPPHILFLSVLFYWYNPISMVNIWNRFLYNFMSFYALLPLVVFLYIRGIHMRQFRYSFFIGLSSFLGSYALTSVPFNLLVWFVFVYILLFYFFSADSKHFKIFGVKFFIFTLFCYLAMNYWWISQLFSFIQSSGYTSSVSNFFSVSGNLYTLSALSETLGQFSDLFRYMHHSFYDGEAWWVKLYSVPVVIFIQFLASILILWTLTKFRRTVGVLLLGTLFVFSLFLMKGNNYPFGELFQFFFLKISPLQVFRNPFEKFSFVLILTATPLFSFGLWKLTSASKNLTLKKGILIGSCAFLFIYWGFPFLSGIIFTRSSNSPQQLTYEVRIPDYYIKLNEWMNQNSQGMRFVSLPIGGEGMTYQWEKPYSGVELSATLFDTPNISFNTSIPFYSQIVSDFNKYQINSKIANLMPFVAGKYLLVRKDIDFQERKVADPKNVQNKLEEMSEKGLVNHKLDLGKTSIYEINSRYQWPKVYITNNIVMTNETNIAKLSEVEPKFPDEKFAVIDFGPTNVPVNTLVMKPLRVFSPRAISSFKNLKEEDILARLFYAEHLPGDPFYFAIKLKEDLLTPNRADFSGRLLYRTGILGKRAAEVYKLRLKKKDSMVIAKAQSDYLQELNMLAPYLNSAIKNNDPVSTVVKDSLLYQQILFRRSGSELAQNLSEMIFALEITPYFALPTELGDFYVYLLQVPSSAKYILKFDRPLNQIRWFLDGKEIAVESLKSQGQEGEIRLSAGNHELAVVGRRSTLSSDVVKEDFFNVDNTNLKSWRIDIGDDTETYRVNFEYRFEEGDTFKLKFVQDIETDDKPVFFSDLNIDKKFPDRWLEWEGEFSTTPGATFGILQTQSNMNEDCYVKWIFINKCHSRKRFKVQVRNFKVRRINTPDLLLKYDLRAATPSSTIVEWLRNNPSSYIVKITKSNKQDEMLVFSELYNSLWQAKYIGGGVISEDRHYLVNNYANGWLINKPGQYEIELHFLGQDSLDKGKLISTLAIFSGLVLLSLSLLKKRSND